MESMSLDPPEPIKRFVQERTTAGGYESASEYVRDLIRADQRRQVQERVDSLLLEGLDSGEPISVSDEYWEQRKRKLVERFGEADRPKRERRMSRHIAPRTPSGSPESHLGWEENPI